MVKAEEIKVGSVLKSQITGVVFRVYAAVYPGKDSKEKDPTFKCIIDNPPDSVCSITGKEFPNLYKIK